MVAVAAVARRRAGARLGPVAAARGRALPARGAGLRARAGSGDGGGELGPEPIVVSVAAPALAVVGWSEVVLFKTGCGLPPGPGGLLGALEGVSYLVLVAVVGWSVKTKVDTGSGLPAGPFGLLGAVEGFAFLLAAAGVGVAAYSAVANGCAPFCCRPLPPDFPPADSPPPLFPSPAASCPPLSRTRTASAADRRAPGT